MDLVDVVRLLVGQVEDNFMYWLEDEVVEVMLFCVLLLEQVFPVDWRINLQIRFMAFLINY